MNRVSVLLGVLGLTLGAGAGCSSSETLEAQTKATQEGDTATAGGDPGPAQGDTQVGNGDAGSGDATPEPIQYSGYRGVAHVHSPFSHDACDEEGIVEGVINDTCMTQLREALCANGLDFAMLTDHPSHMRNYEFSDLLLFRASEGDVLTYNGSLEPIANTMACPSGHTVLLTVGYEGSPHTMPLGMQHHVAEEFYAGLQDSTPASTAQTLVAELQAAGATVALAHSEEEDISVDTIVQSGLDAMEWYNPHGNFSAVLGEGDSISGSPEDIFDTLLTLGRFILGAPSGPHPDLVYMLLLQHMPEAGFTKWREVQAQAQVAGLLGSDVHQNVSIDPVCSPDNPILYEACIAGASTVLPEHLLEFLSGGQITLGDNDRLDSYQRVTRWLHNRVLATERTAEAMLEALKVGRSYGVFSVFGNPAGFGFEAEKPDGTVVHLGETTSGSMIIRIKAPDVPVPGPAKAAQFDATQAALASIRTVLYRTASGGSTVEVASQTGLGVDLEHATANPGAYHVEVFITPGHLAESLGTEAQLAEQEYLWLITNPIRMK